MVRAVASSSAVSQKNLAGTLSAPEALLGFRSLRSFLTPGMVMIMSGIWGNFGLPRYGVLSETGEKTLENWRFREFALSLGWTWVIPFSVRGETPLLSVRLVFTYRYRNLLLRDSSSEICLAIYVERASWHVLRVLCGFI